MKEQALQIVDVVVPAAGVGRRMGAQIPKQYLTISTQTVLEHTLSRLLEVDCLNNIIVVLGAEDEYFKDLAISSHPRLKLALGGKERGDSVLNGLKLATTDFVLVHDAARPCVLVSDIKALVLQCTDDNGGILAAPLCDTIKRASPDHRIAATVPRDGLYRAFTPQNFKRELLIKAYEEAAQKHLVLTDEASAMEALGYEPRLIRGDAMNIKITEPSDLALAEFYLSCQRHKK